MELKAEFKRRMAEGRPFWAHFIDAEPEVLRMEAARLLSNAARNSPETAPFLARLGDTLVYLAERHLDEPMLRSAFEKAAARRRRAGSGALKVSAVFCRPSACGSVEEALHLTRPAASPVFSPSAPST